MKNPFYKSNLTKSEKLEVESVKRKEGSRFLLGILVFVGVFYAYTLNFEVKLLKILAESSMVDQSGTLTLDDQREIKEVIDLLHDYYGFATQYFIGYQSLKIPEVSTPTVFIGINPQIHDILVYMPSGYSTALARLDADMRMCLSPAEEHTQENIYEYSANLEWDEKLAPCLLFGLENLLNNLSDPTTF